MVDKSVIDDLLEKTGLFMMKEYGLDALHVLEKIMCSPFTQDLYDGRQSVKDMTPEVLGHYYIDMA